MTEDEKKPTPESPSQETVVTKDNPSQPQANPSLVEEKRKGGHEGRDWEALYQEWTESGKHRLDFLEEKGISRTSAQTYRRTKDWEARFSGKADAILSKRASSLHSAKQRVAEVVPAMPEADKVKIGQVIGLRSRDVTNDAMATGWQMIMKWRAKQAIDDWKDADRVRLVLKILLQNAITKDGLDENGEPVFKVKIKPHEIKALMQTLADAQRVQRLALGLSTDNIGVDQPAPAEDSNVEKKQAVDGEENVPYFIVEMSKHGKFVRARPRRVN